MVLSTHFRGRRFAAAALWEKAHLLSFWTKPPSCICQRIEYAPVSQQLRSSSLCLSCDLGLQHQLLEVQELVILLEVISSHVLWLHVWQVSKRRVQVLQAGLQQPAICAKCRSTTLQVCVQSLCKWPAGHHGVCDQLQVQGAAL